MGINQSIANILLDCLLFNGKSTATAVLFINMNSE